MVFLIAAFPADVTSIANVTVWSTKKSDRGRFSVSVGQTLLVSYALLTSHELNIGRGSRYPIAGNWRSVHKLTSGDYHSASVLQTEVSFNVFITANSCVDVMRN